VREISSSQRLLYPPPPFVLHCVFVFCAIYPRISYLIIPCTAARTSSIKCVHLVCCRKRSRSPVGATHRREKHRRDLISVLFSVSTFNFCYETPCFEACFRLLKVIKRLLSRLFCIRRSVFYAPTIDVRIKKKKKKSKINPLFRHRKSALDISRVTLECTQGKSYRRQFRRVSLIIR